MLSSQQRAFFCALLWALETTEQATAAMKFVVSLPYDDQASLMPVAAMAMKLVGPSQTTNPQEDNPPDDGS